MQYTDQAKALYQLTTELTDKKVEVAVSNAIKDVVNQIIELRHEMNERFAKVENRLIALETALYRRDQNRSEIRTRLYDFAFKACWLLLGSVLVYLTGHFHISIQ